jgi:hypothetical protein
LLRGDSALYNAKVAGRNRISCHDGAAIKTPANQPVPAAPPLGGTAPCGAVASTPSEPLLA